MDLINVSKEANNNNDQFEIYFFIQDYSIIQIEGGGSIKRNITKELGLKVISGKYFVKRKRFKMNPKMQHLLKLIEDKYGEVEFKKDGSFYLNLETIVDNKKIVYFFTVGKKGQEIVNGYCLEEKSLLDNEECRDIMKKIDNTFLNLINLAGI